MKHIKPLPFFAIGIAATIAGVVVMTGHQHNVSKQVVTLMAHDAAGLDTTVDQQTIANYIHAHMGTSTHYALVTSYNQAATAAQAAANPQSNGQVYSQAQSACAGHADSIVQARCVSAYVAAHAAPSANPQASAMPKQSDYTKTLTAPTWTPDLAGIAFLAALASTGMGIFLLMKR